MQGIPNLLGTLSSPSKFDTLCYVVVPIRQQTVLLFKTLVNERLCAEIKLHLCLLLLSGHHSK